MIEITKCPKRAAWGYPDDTCAMELIASGRTYQMRSLDKINADFKQDSVARFPVTAHHGPSRVLSGEGKVSKGVKP